MSPSPIKILLIDDDPDAALLVREALDDAEPGRFTLTHARDLTSGLALLANGEDLILLDLSLPDGLGLETFRAVQAHAPKMPIVVLSGLDDPALVASMLREGGQDYLAKGQYDGPSLARATRFAIHRKRAEHTRFQALDELEARLRGRNAALETASETLHDEVALRHRAEAEAAAARERAEAAVLARDRFLSLISHELRTPLTPVLFAVTALLDDPEALDLRSSLEMIARNVQLEIRLIEDLLDLGRLARGRLPLKREMVDVHDLIRVAAESHRGEARAAGLEIQQELTATAPFVAADPSRLRQTIEGLLHNAVKFSPAGQPVRIRTRDLAARPGGAGGRLVLEVIDSGLGIEPEALSRIFEPFEQGDSPTRRRSAGLGLGLALARSVAESHGGTLTATSPGLNRGATFTLELPPLLGPQANSVEPISPTLDRPEVRSILLVEDNPDTLRYLTILLQHRGHRVRPAATLADARALANVEEFDLILSDIELPDGNGLDLVREVHARRPIPAIAMSGFGSDCDIRLSRDAGFLDHLTKPIDARALDTLIRRVSTPGGQARRWSVS